MERILCPTTCDIEERADNSPKIRGLAGVVYDGTPETQYELWPGVVERFLPGAFDRASQEDDVRALWNHNREIVLGRRSANTLQLKTDRRGLHYVIEPPDTQAARDAMTLIRRGDVSGSSIGFFVRTEEWRLDGGIEVREIQDIELLDVSPVTFPAYTSTTASVRHSEEHLFDARSSYHVWKERQQYEEQRRRTLDTLAARVRMAELV